MAAPQRAADDLAARPGPGAPLRWAEQVPDSPRALAQRRQLQRLFGAGGAAAGQPLQAARPGQPLPADRPGPVLQRYGRIAAGAADYPVKKAWGLFRDTATPDKAIFSRQDEAGGSFFADAEKTKPRITVRADADLLVSDNRDLAIEATGPGQEAKVFFATLDRVSEANDALAGKIKLKAGNDYLQITVADEVRKLYRIEPYHTESGRQGADLRAPQRCNEMAQMASGNLDVTGFSAMDVGNDKALRVLDHFQHDAHWQQRHDEARQAAIRERPRQADYLHLLDEIATAYNDLAAARGHDAAFQAELQALGINQFMDPAVGQAIGTVSMASDQDMRAAKDAGQAIFQYHWATVVARSGGDYVTIENYARDEGDMNTCPLLFFKMYGTAVAEQTWHQAALDSNFFLNPIISFTMA